MASNLYTDNQPKAHMGVCIEKKTDMFQLLLLAYKLK